MCVYHVGTALKHVIHWVYTNTNPSFYVHGKYMCCPCSHNLVAIRNRSIMIRQSKGLFAYIFGHLAIQMLSLFVLYTQTKKYMSDFICRNTVLV